MSIIKRVTLRDAITEDVESEMRGYGKGNGNDPLDVEDEINSLSNLELIDLISKYLEKLK